MVDRSAVTGAGVVHVGPTITSMRIPSGLWLRSAGQTNLGQANLGQTNLGQTNLGQTNLGQTNLGQTNLGQANLSPTNLGQANLVRTNLGRTNAAEYLTGPGDSRFTLLLGTPGGQLPGADSVVEAIRSLEAAVRDRLVLTVYGAEPHGQLSLGQKVADALGVPIRTHHGALTTELGGTARRTAVDASDNPSWQPFAELSTYRPGRVGVQVDRWWAPFPEARVVSPARYWLTPDWIMDVVPAGLVVRPTEAVPNPLLRCAPTHPDRVDLVVDTPGGRALPDDMLTALGRLGDAMPSAARSRLRLVLTADVAPASERALQWAVPAPQVSWSRPIGVAPASIQPSEQSGGSASTGGSVPAGSQSATDSSSVGWAPPPHSSLI